MIDLYRQPPKKKTNCCRRTKLFLHTSFFILFFIHCSRNFNMHPTIQHYHFTEIFCLIYKKCIKCYFSFLCTKTEIKTIWMGLFVSYEFLINIALNILYFIKHIYILLYYITGIMDGDGGCMILFKPLFQKRLFRKKSFIEFFYALY